MRSRGATDGASSRAVSTPLSCGVVTLRARGATGGCVIACSTPLPCGVVVFAVYLRMFAVPHRFRNGRRAASLSGGILGTRRYVGRGGGEGVH